MNQEDKNYFTARWKKYFPGAALPVAVFYSNELHKAEPVKKPDSGHRCMVADFTKVFGGKSLAFDAATIGCRGGLRYCGFSDKLSPDFEYFLSYGIEGKLEGERYKRDPETVKELMKKTPVIKAPATYLIAKPFEQLDAEDEPEIILFFSPPDVIAGLFTLANFDRTDLYGVKVPFCAGCGSMVLYPWLENQKEEPDCIMGLFDSSARPYVKSNLISFAVPMKRFEKLAGYMDESFLITETWEVMRRRMEL